MAVPRENRNLDSQEMLRSGRKLPPLARGRSWGLGSPTRLGPRLAQRRGRGVLVPMGPWFHMGHWERNACQVLSGGGGWRFENQSEPINLSLTPSVPECSHCTCVAGMFLPRSHAGEHGAWVPAPGPSRGPRLAAASPDLRTGTRPRGNRALTPPPHSPWGATWAHGGRLAQKTPPGRSLCLAGPWWAPWAGAASRDRPVPRHCRAPAGTVVAVPALSCLKGHGFTPWGLVPFVSPRAERTWGGRCVCRGLPAARTAVDTQGWQRNCRSQHRARLRHAPPVLGLHRDRRPLGDRGGDRAGPRRRAAAPPALQDMLLGDKVQHGRWQSPGSPAPPICSHVAFTAPEYRGRGAVLGAGGGPDGGAWIPAPHVPGGSWGRVLRPEPEGRLASHRSVNSACPASIFASLLRLSYLLWMSRDLRLQFQGEV